MEPHPSDTLVPQRQELHPLFNDLTLSKILSHLPPSTLLTCRLVCKTWAFSPEIHRLQTSVTIHLSSYSILDKFLSYLSSCSGANCTANVFLPFTHFDLDFTRQCHPLCDSSHALTTAEEAATLLGKGKLAQFLSILSEKRSSLSPKYLKLTLDKTHLDLDGFVTLIQNAPDLETLYIYNLSHRAVFSQSLTSSWTFPKLRKLVMDEIRIPIPVFMGEFLTLCPNLEEIVLRCDKRSDWSNQAGIWKEHSPLATSIIKGLVTSCATSCVPGRSCKLKLFSCGILNRSHFQALTGLGESRTLRLTTLEIYCPAKDVDSGLLKSFLKTQASSLKVLRVLGNVDKLRRAVGNNNQGQNGVEPLPPDLFLLELPDKMEALEVFQLSGRDKDTPLPVVGLRFGTQFQKLVTLVVNGFASNIGDRMESYFPWIEGQEPCATVRNLVLPAELRCPDFPVRVSQLFPGVTRLEVKYPDNCFLSAVVQSWQGLEELRILVESGPSVEEGISGIMGLSRLKVLEITVETEHREVPTALGDTVVASLIKMKNLRRLILLSCCWFDGLLPCNFLSQKCQKDLVQQLERCVIIFTPVGEPSGCPTSEEDNGNCKIEGFYGS